jgi:putative oxidoreductase
MKLALLITRVLVGALFVGHGTQKLFGWFGGHGLEGTGGAMAAGAAEAGGGALLAVGLLTPLAAGAITGSMIQAIQTVHAANGPWVTDQGWEYNAVIVGTVLVIAEAGPGDLSLDHALGIELSGTKWAVLAFAAGAVGPPLLVNREAPAPAPAG